MREATAELRKQRGDWVRVGSSEADVRPGHGLNAPAEPVRAPREFAAYDKFLKAKEKDGEA